MSRRASTFPPSRERPSPSTAPRSDPDLELGAGERNCDRYGEAVLGKPCSSAHRHLDSVSRSSGCSPKCPAFDARSWKKGPAHGGAPSIAAGCDHDTAFGFDRNALAHLRGNHADNLAAPVGDQLVGWALIQQHDASVSMSQRCGADAALAALVPTPANATAHDTGRCHLYHFAASQRILVISLSAPFVKKPRRPWRNSRKWHSKFPLPDQY